MAMGELHYLSYCQLFPRKKKSTAYIKLLKALLQALELYITYWLPQEYLFLLVDA
jgi:hypothetical protein